MIRWPFVVLLHRYRHLAGALLIGWPALALAAGGSATLQTFDPDGEAVTVSIETLDGQRLRLASPDHPEAYLLMLGSRTYNVMQFGGMPLVMDAADMLTQMGAPMPAAPAPTDDIRKLVSLDPTGESETVAGIVGQRQRLRYLDSQNQMREEEVVTARDPLLHELSMGMYRAGVVMSAAAGVTAPDGSDQLARQLDAKGLGLLRMGTRMRVIAVDRRAPPVARFELPAEPMQRFPPLLE